MGRKSAFDHTKNLGVKAIDFKSISHRGRIGYILCCLENTIAHQGLNHPRWQIILDLVWKGTESNYWFLESEFQGISPWLILRYPNFESYTLEVPPRTILEDTYYAESESEFNELRTIYE